MKVRRAGQREEETELQMTPMIDIVFQLLIFFIMTFKIVSPEGDFNVKMPLAAPSEGMPDPAQLPPIKVTLRAGAGGGLSTIRMGTKTLENLDRLRPEILAIVGKEHGPGSLAAETEVEFDCDYDLKFEIVIDAITQVSGRVEKGRQGEQVIKMVEKIKFSPPKKPT
jgi:biopolymer transport protein ExbD